MEIQALRSILFSLAEGCVVWMAAGIIVSGVNKKAGAWIIAAPLMVVRWLIMKALAGAGIVLAGIGREIGEALATPHRYFMRNWPWRTRFAYFGCFAVTGLYFYIRFL